MAKKSRRQIYLQVPTYYDKSGRVHVTQPIPIAPSHIPLRHTSVSKDTKFSIARSFIRQEPALEFRAINLQLRNLFGSGLPDRDITNVRKSTFQISDRSTRLSKVRDIIRQEPSLKKEEIRARLQAEFGVGIRDATILKAKRDIFKESPKIIPDKNLNRRYIKSLFGSQQEQRFNKLLSSKIWTHKESLSLSNLPLSRLQYLEDMAKSRHNLIEQMRIQKRENHWTKAEYEKHLNEAIQAEYMSRGWLNKKGELEIFRMVDDFRQSVIDEGKDPSPGKRRHIFRNPDGSIRILRDKGNTTAQKSRYRELHPDVIREQKRNYRMRVKARVAR